QGLLKVNFGRILLDGFLNDVVLLVKIGLGFDAAADFGNGGRLLLPLCLLHFNFQGLKKWVARMLVEKVLTDFQRFREVLIRQVLSALCVGASRGIAFGANLVIEALVLSVALRRSGFWPRAIDFEKPFQLA